MKKFLLTISLISVISLTACVRSAQDISNTSDDGSMADSSKISETEPSPEEQEWTEPAPVDDEKLAGMSIHDKICQMFIVSPETLTGYDWQSEWDTFTEDCYNAYPVGGIILFDQNIYDVDQLATFVSQLRGTAQKYGTDVFMSVDEEGGDIARLQSKLGGDAVGSMKYYGDLNDYSQTFSAGQTIGNELVSYGFNLDFAPVADVEINPTNELGTRIFSSDPQVVADMTAAFIDGLHSCDILSTLKHFPGLGAGDGNTHYDSVFIDRTLDELRETEFKAFKGGIDAGADFVMVGHQITSASGEEIPGDLSHTVVTDWLRNELGFNGIIVTDSHSMGAITSEYSSGEASVKAIQAGVDMILMPLELADAVSAVEKAVEDGEITEDRINESVARILDKKRDMGITE